MPVTIECLKTESYLFQGEVKGNIKCGEGVLMLRNGMMVCGSWSNDFLEGRALVFPAFGGRALVNFKRGKLGGWMLSFYGSNILRCTLYFENQIEGERLTFDLKEQMWVASRCTTEGKIISLIHA